MTIDTSSWDKVTLGDIAQSLTIATKDPLSEGFGRYVGLEHIEPGNIHIKSWGNVADGTTFTRVFRKGQVLFGKRRAYQKKTAMAEFDGICSGDILVCEAIKGAVVPELLPFIVQSDRFFEHAIKTSAGSLSPRTKFKDLAKFTFKLPAKPADQKRIADLLWSIDVAVEKKKILLISMLDVLLGCTNQALVGEKGLKAWPKKRLGDCLSEKPMYGAPASAKTYTPGSPRYVRITDIDDEGRLNADDVVSADLDSYEAYVLRKDDFLFARTGNTVGKTYLYKDADGFCIYAGYLIRFRLDGSIILPEFLHLFTHSSLYAEFKKNTIKVGAQPNINAEEYQSMIIPVPTVDEQEIIVNKIHKIKELVQNLRGSIQILQRINREIINQIFT